MIFITRIETFSAAHKLHKPEWSDARNQEVFGKCANHNWHGHNYTLTVTVKGNPDPVTGFVVNLSDLGRIMHEEVIKKVDHKNLNMDVDFMKGKMASTEVLAIEIWNVLLEPIQALGCALHSVKIQETAKNYVEYFGIN